MYKVESAIEIARSQIGYREEKKDGSYNNNQKYSDQLPGFGWSDYRAWCATFYQWCLYQVGVTVPSGARSASCIASARAYEQADRFTEYPGKGFQVFFGVNGGTHTGMVVDYDNDWIWTVEGNTNDDGSAEGNGVYFRKRARKTAYVYGYGIPYFASKAVCADPNWNGKDLSK